MVKRYVYHCDTFNVNNELSKVGFKTILHLAIDEDDYDTTPYIDALLQVQQINSSPNFQSIVIRLEQVLDMSTVSCFLLQSMLQLTKSRLMLSNCFWNIQTIKLTWMLSTSSASPRSTSFSLNFLILPSFKTSRHPKDLARWNSFKYQYKLWKLCFSDDRWRHWQKYHECIWRNQTCVHAKRTEIWFWPFSTNAHIFRPNVLLPQEDLDHDPAADSLPFPDLECSSN